MSSAISCDCEVGDSFEGRSVGERSKTAAAGGSRDVLDNLSVFARSSASWWVRDVSCDIVARRALTSSSCCDLNSAMEGCTATPDEGSGEGPSPRAFQSVPLTNCMDRLRR